MVNARFQVVSLPRVPGTVGSTGEKDGSAPPRRFTWRFLAGNNRALAMATIIFADADSCLADLREIQRGLPDAQREFTRDPDGKWTWAVRVPNATAASGHRYSRQLRARTTCASFFVLAAQADALRAVQVVYR